MKRPERTVWKLVPPLSRRAHASTTAKREHCSIVLRKIPEVMD